MPRKLVLIAFETAFDSIGAVLATMSEDGAERLAADPEAAYVEQNRAVRIQGTQTDPPSWGLDRRMDRGRIPGSAGSEHGARPRPNVGATG